MTLQKPCFGVMGNVRVFIVVASKDLAIVVAVKWTQLTLALVPFQNLDLLTK